MKGFPVKQEILIEGVESVKIVDFSPSTPLTISSNSTKNLEKALNLSNNQFLQENPYLKCSYMPYMVQNQFTFKFKILPIA